MREFSLIQVGAGLWGREWAELLAEAKAFRLAALVDRAAEVRAWAGGVLGCPVFGDLGAALRSVDCDAVLVLAPPGAHLALAEEALAARRHVLVEKPLALTLAHARAIADAGARSGLVTMVSQNYRFRRQPRALRELVRSKALGRLRGGRISCRRDLRGLHRRADWRGRMAHPYLLDMAIHHVDLLRMITGEEIVEVDVRSWPSPDGPFRHDASVAGVVTLSGGAALGYDGTWTAPSDRTSWNGDWELAGTRGRAAWEGGVNHALRGRVVLDATGHEAGPVRLPSLPGLDRRGVLHEFRRAAAEGDEAECSARDNLASLATVLAMACSCEERRPVTVREVLAE